MVATEIAVCKVCQRPRTPREAKTFGSRCEDCWAGRGQFPQRQSSKCRPAEWLDRHQQAGGLFKEKHDG